MNNPVAILLLVILVLLLFGAFPVWPHTSAWGYGPSGMMALIIVIVIVVMIMRR